MQIWTFLQSEGWMFFVDSNAVNKRTNIPPSNMNKRMSLVEPLPSWADKEAVVDAGSEAGDLFHKLEVKELSRESVRFTASGQFSIVCGL